MQPMIFHWGSSEIGPLKGGEKTAIEDYLKRLVYSTIHLWKILISALNFNNADTLNILAICF